MSRRPTPTLFAKMPPSLALAELMHESIRTLMSMRRIDRHTRDLCQTAILTKVGICGTDVGDQTAWNNFMTALRGLDHGDLTPHIQKMVLENKLPFSAAAINAHLQAIGQLSSDIFPTHFLIDALACGSMTLEDIQHLTDLMALEPAARTAQLLDQTTITAEQANELQIQHVAGLASLDNKYIILGLLEGVFTAQQVIDTDITELLTKRPLRLMQALRHEWLSIESATALRANNCLTDLLSDRGLNAFAAGHTTATEAASMPNRRAVLIKLKQIEGTQAIQAAASQPTLSTSAGGSKGP